MTHEADVEELASRAAERVREVLADAQRRADAIVREAEQEAARIRAGAEADARERIDSAKRALDELGGRLGAGPAAEPPAVAVEAPSEPPPAEEPPGAPEAPTSPPAEPGDGGGEGDEPAARLVAMKMALDGKGREEIERRLSDRFGPGDRTALLDEVLARAAK